MESHSDLLHSASQPSQVWCTALCATMPLIMRNISGKLGYLNAGKIVMHGIGLCGVCDAVSFLRPWAVAGCTIEV